MSNKCNDWSPVSKQKFAELQLNTAFTVTNRKTLFFAYLDPYFILKGRDFCVHDIKLNLVSTKEKSKQQDRQTNSNFIQNLEMYPANRLFFLVTALFLSALTMKVSHSLAHFENAVATHATQPIAPVLNSQTQPKSNVNQANLNSPQLNQYSSLNKPQPISIQPDTTLPIVFPPSCLNGKVWSPKHLGCICPVDKPYADSVGDCLACSAPQFWVAKLLTCMICPPGFLIDKIEGRCYCPQDKPYVDFNTTCQPCPLPAAWDVKNKKCVRCPEDFTFDQESSQCSCPKEKPYLDNDNTCQACEGEWDFVTLKCKKCENGHVWNAVSHKCECKGESFDDGTGKCIACPKPAAWDLNHKKCVRCPEGFTFDQKVSECSCPKDKPYLDDNNSCQAVQTKCPKETPVWDGKQCKACPAGKYVATTKTCTI